MPCVSSEQVTAEVNYESGDDYVVEFLGYRFAFNAEDFEERVIAAAVKLGLVESNDLDEDEAADLVELTADQRIEEARSSLGRYLVRHWEALAAVDASHTRSVTGFGFTPTSRCSLASLRALVRARAVLLAA
jgi:hypothetical protein